MAFKEYTAGEAYGLMPKELSKREKRFAMRAIRKAARKGYNYVDFEAAWFKASTEVLVEYFTNLNYCCRYRYLCNELTVSWDGAGKD